jgi:SAM-dependent methyltransferase
VSENGQPTSSGEIDATVPHSARIWNYWLGGKDNYPADRTAGEAWIKTDPSILDIARVSRAFLNRAVVYLAGEVGIRQFLDVGTGLPTANNTHEVAQAVAPATRIVYVDNDPLVLAHARALLVSSPQGATSYIDADMNNPAEIIDQARSLLDFDQPIALMFMGVLGHVTSLDDARGIVNGLLEHLPSGSYLAHWDDTLPFELEARRRAQQAQQDYADTGAVPYWSRSSGELASFYYGLDFVDPGFVRVPLWRPDIALPSSSTLSTLPTTPTQENVTVFGGVARKS